jgi:hypothetical protein
MLLEFLKFAPHPNPLPQGEGADSVTVINILPHFDKEYEGIN